MAQLDDAVIVNALVRQALVSAQEVMNAKVQSRFVIFITLAKLSKWWLGQRIICMT